MSAIYQGIDITRQRVAGCATQRHIANRTHVYTRARVHPHRERKRRRPRALWGVGLKGTRINGTINDGSFNPLVLQLIYFLENVTRKDRKRTLKRIDILFIRQSGTDVVSFIQIQANYFRILRFDYVEIFPRWILKYRNRFEVYQRAGISKLITKIFYVE